MKKKYEKPEILMESFELTQHIASCGPQTDSKVNTDLTAAGNCTVKVYFANKQNCYIDDNKKTSPSDLWESGGMTAFSNGNKSCTELEGYCYTEGVASMRIFGS